jgi:hypothetical protein
MIESKKPGGDKDWEAPNLFDEQSARPDWSGEEVVERAEILDVPNQSAKRAQSGFKRPGFVPRYDNARRDSERNKAVAEARQKIHDEFAVDQMSEIYTAVAEEDEDRIKGYILNAIGTRSFGSFEEFKIFLSGLFHVAGEHTSIVDVDTGRSSNVKGKTMQINLRPVIGGKGIFVKITLENLITYTGKNLTCVKDLVESTPEDRNTTKTQTKHVGLFGRFAGLFKKS